MAKVKKGKSIKARRCCSCYTIETYKDSKSRKTIKNKEVLHDDDTGVTIEKPDIDSEFCEVCGTETEFIDVDAVELKFGQDTMLVQGGPSAINSLLRLKKLGHQVDELIEELS